jgi:hypothetical protein
VRGDPVPRGGQRHRSQQLRAERAGHAAVAENPKPLDGCGRDPETTGVEAVIEARELLGLLGAAQAADHQAGTLGAVLVGEHDEHQRGQRRRRRDRPDAQHPGLQPPQDAVLARGLRVEALGVQVEAEHPLDELLRGLEVGALDHIAGDAQHQAARAGLADPDRQRSVADDVPALVGAAVAAVRRQDVERVDGGRQRERAGDLDGGRANAPHGAHSSI